MLSPARTDFFLLSSRNRMRVSIPATPCLFPWAFYSHSPVSSSLRTSSPLFCTSHLLYYRLSLTACLAILFPFAWVSRTLFEHTITTKSSTSTVPYGRSGPGHDRATERNDAVGRFPTKSLHITMRASTGTHTVFRVVTSSQESYISIVSTPAH